MIAPAPRKPMPLTICAEMRVGSTRGPVNPYAETSVKSAEPTETTRCVRRPACRSRSSRSNPIAPPSTAATKRRRRTCGQASDGTPATATLRKCNRGRLRLPLADLADSGGRQLEQLVEQLAGERIALRRRLHLDQATVAGHDDVHVGVGARVFRVVEVEHRDAV